jgi:aryl-alcohol dehydrogenase-like predicted oxidoreductase
MPASVEIRDRNFERNVQIGYTFGLKRYLGTPLSSDRSLQSNLKLAEAVKDLAARKGCSPAQFALAWVLAQGNDMIPIPGTKRVRYLKDNMGVLAVNLTPDDLKETDERIRGVSVADDRYTPEMMAMVNR